LSEELREYIVVHELCHLQEMNHSSNFWNLVAQKIPDYKERRKDLKKLRI
jgi:predicted metal-dependent hydrolase